MDHVPMGPWTRALGGLCCAGGMLEFTSAARIEKRQPAAAGLVTDATHSVSLGLLKTPL